MKQKNSELLQVDILLHPNSTLKERAERLGWTSVTVATHYQGLGYKPMKQATNDARAEALKKDIEQYPKDTLKNRGKRLGLTGAGVNYYLNKLGYQTKKVSTKIKVTAEALNLAIAANPIPAEEESVRGYKKNLAHLLGVSTVGLWRILKKNHLTIPKSERTSNIINSIKHDLETYPKDLVCNRLERLKIKLSTYNYFLRKYNESK